MKKHSYTVNTRVAANPPSLRVSVLRASHHHTDSHHIITRICWWQCPRFKVHKWNKSSHFSLSHCSDLSKNNNKQTTNKQKN